MLLTNLSIATMVNGYGHIENGAVQIENGIIKSVGPDTSKGDAVDCDGRLLTPGLIDCHTHLVYGGNRAAEFEQRLNGATYADIAKAGGGIMSTVRATRAASEAELLESALRRLESLLAEGVTTIEIKSGYGLDVETEIKMLKVARKLGTLRPVDVKTTFLGAHTFPQEFREDHEAYLKIVCDQALPRISAEGLADAVDGFCEGIAFSVEETRTVFKAARAFKLPVKLHAEQLSNLGGAKMAARFKALSVDHIEYLDEEGVESICKSGTVAVLLPGAFYYLREKQAPPVAALRKHKVPIAIATDLNPGSSPGPFPARHHEHGLRPVRPHPRRGALGRHRQCRPGPWSEGPRHHRRGPEGRSRPLGRQAPRRPRLSPGVQSPRRRHQEWRTRQRNPPVNQMQPLYMQVKDHILGHIQSGTWAAGSRVPSENELVGSFGISRMTANRALRELTADGYLARVPGVGTFVKEQTARTSLMELRNIAEEIATRGHKHSSRLITREKITASPFLTEEFEWKSPQGLFHLAIVHEENGLPVQLENRWVNPHIAPDFLIQSFTKQTPTAYLLNTVPVDELEHSVRAMLPDAAQQELLNIKPHEPCLALHRRSWNQGQVVTVATLIYPASRYGLHSRYKTNAQGKPL